MYPSPFPCTKCGKHTLVPDMVLNPEDFVDSEHPVTEGTIIFARCTECNSKHIVRMGEITGDDIEIQVVSVDDKTYESLLGGPNNRLGNWLVDREVN